MSSHSFSESVTWELIEFLINNEFKFEFYLNDTFIVCSKIFPVEIVKILNDKSEKTFDISCKSIFSINDKTIVLLEVKIDTLKKIVCLFPIEARHTINELGTDIVVSEVIVDNPDIKLVCICDILLEIKSKLTKLVIDSQLEKTKSLIDALKISLDFIWGSEEKFLEPTKVLDKGLSSWYQKVCELNSVHTVKSELINIPDSLISEYFESEVENSINYNLLSNNSRKCVNKIEQLFTENYITTGVVPKFTWSTPTDATWIISERSLCCRTFEDILLLLKASKKVADDIEHAKKNNIENTLLLREYILKMNEMLEFRVFLGYIAQLDEYKIIGISQRNIHNYYEELNINIDLKKEIVSCIFNFFMNRSITKDLFRIFNTKFIALDICLLTEGVFLVFVIDARPLTMTSTLLFDKNDLRIYYLSNQGYDVDLDVLRLVEDKYPITNKLDDCFSGRVPEEFLSLENLSSINIDHFT